MERLIAKPGDGADAGVAGCASTAPEIWHAINKIAARALNTWAARCFVIDFRCCDEKIQSKRSGHGTRLIGHGDDRVEGIRRGPPGEKIIPPACVS
jgi:hypothetical protein